MIGWACDRIDDRFGSRDVRRGFDGMFNKGDLGVDDLDVVEGCIGFDGRGHVWVIMGGCCCKKDLREWIETLHFL